MKITGVMFYYFFVCKRKLWLFSNGISLEDENQNVKLGKLLDEKSYQKEEKHIMIDETINVDFIKKWKVIHEIKKSNSIEEASMWQLKYYLYYLKNKGIKIEKGIIDYPKLREIKEIILEKEDSSQIEIILKEIRYIINLESPPIFKKIKICNKCAYYDFCII